MNRSAILGLLALAAWIIFGTYMCYTKLCGAATTTAAATTVTTPAKAAFPGNLTLKDGSFTAAANNNFTFSTSKFSYLTPMALDLDAMVSKAAEYLKTNSDRSMTITGYYGDGESNGSALSDLGLARANNIKAILTSLGVSGTQLMINSKKVGADWFKDGKLLKGIDFSFGKAVTEDETNKKLADIKARLLGKPMVLYFKSGEGTISPDAQQRKDFQDMIYYLDNAKDSKLEIGGHSDNVGNRRDNLDLSKKRAGSVGEYLTTNGIAKKSMIVKGYGQSKPVAKNSTKEGKAKNRRVEVILK